MQTVYLGLGSNLGDRAGNLRAAVKALAPQVTPLAESALYETPAWGVEDQPGFLNMALETETELTPMALRDHVKGIESRMGRTPSYHWGPRLIDIDILLYDDAIIDTRDLVIPHPQMHKRPFVLVPLASIAPDVVQPALGLSIRQLLQHVDTTGIAAPTAAAACLSGKGMPLDFLRPSFARPAAMAPEETRITSRPWSMIADTSPASCSMRFWSSPSPELVSTALPTLMTTRLALE